MAILSKGCKPDKFEPHNSLKLSFTNIRGLRSNFVECESFLESNSPDILALCETNLDDSIDSGNFSVRGYLPLIWKDSTTHIHGLAVYVKEGLPFAWDLSLENSADSYLCFWLALLHSVSYFFFLYRSPSSSLCTVFDLLIYLSYFLIGSVTYFYEHMLMKVSLKNRGLENKIKIHLFQMEECFSKISTNFLIFL